MRDNRIRDLNELAVFTYVVEQGGFTAAAEATHVTQIKYQPPNRTP